MWLVEEQILAEVIVAADPECFEVAWRGMEMRLGQQLIQHLAAGPAAVSVCRRIESDQMNRSTRLILEAGTSPGSFYLSSASGNTASVPAAVPEVACRSWEENVFRSMEPPVIERVTSTGDQWV